MSGPPPSLNGSNETNLGSNRWLTRENWSLQVDAPAMLLRRDHLLVFALVLPYPATNSGALPTVPPPGPCGSNSTNHGQNHGLTKENRSREVGALATQRDASPRPLWLFPGSPDHLATFLPRSRPP
ncbi:Nfrkb isoform 1 [Dorcoceras hygrometricum]|uniref:Nfrkb isoform 1 n=1 Tax=Dorcoceras hygrometricum TaxID=472368 RepID=A0A2Z7ABL3_9LAMI|nr:Nfrkb isoform 1 [Dorcoceras hygrometricum]